MGRATHRQGVIISQSIQKLSLWRLIFKQNCRSPVVITTWLHLLLLTRVRDEGFASRTGLDCGTGLRGLPDCGTEDGQVTCTPHTCPPQTGSQRMHRHAPYFFQGPGSNVWKKLTPLHATEYKQLSLRLLFYLPPCAL